MKRLILAFVVLAALLIGYWVWPFIGLRAGWNDHQRMSWTKFGSQGSESNGRCGSASAIPRSSLLPYRRARDPVSQPRAPGQSLALGFCLDESGVRASFTEGRRLSGAEHVAPVGLTAVLIDSVRAKMWAHAAIDRSITASP
jgi:hypothetical protein